MRFAFWITTATITHLEYAILLHNNDSYANAPHCYVICTSPVLFRITLYKSQCWRTHVLLTVIWFRLVEVWPVLSAAMCVTRRQNMMCVPIRYRKEPIRTPVKLSYYSSQTRAGEPFWGRMSNLSINFSQSLTHAHEKSEKQYKVLDLPYLLTYLLHRAESFEKPPGSQLVKKFPEFNGARRFIAAFTSARHLFLSWLRSIQSMPPHTTSWSSI
jgi:hypothetical protein